MITRELIERINFLARKERQEGLTGAEKMEQGILRRRYLQAIRAQVIQTLETAGYQRKERHHPECGCGHCHPHKHWKS